MASKFWLENIGELFSDITLIPNTGMTEAERLNCLTRLIIVITIILYLAKIKWWLSFLLISLVIITASYYANAPRPQPLVEFYSCPHKPLTHSSLTPSVHGCSVSSTSVNDNMVRPKITKFKGKTSD